MISKNITWGTCIRMLRTTDLIDILKTISENRHNFMNKDMCNILEGIYCSISINNEIYCKTNKFSRKQ